MSKLSVEIRNQKWFFLLELIRLSAFNRICVVFIILEAMKFAEISWANVISGHETTRKEFNQTVNKKPKANIEQATTLTFFLDLLLVCGMRSKSCRRFFLCSLIAKKSWLEKLSPREALFFWDLSKYWCDCDARWKFSLSKSKFFASLSLCRSEIAGNHSTKCLLKATDCLHKILCDFGWEFFVHSSLSLQ